MLLRRRRNLSCGSDPTAFYLTHTRIARCTTKHKGPLSDAFDLRFNARGRGPLGRMNTYGQVQTPLGSARLPATLRFGSATKVFRFSCVHPAIVRSLTAVQYPIHGNYTMVMVDQYNRSLNLTYRPSATEPGGRKSDVHFLIKDPTHPSKPVSTLSDFHFLDQIADSLNNGYFPGSLTEFGKSRLNEAYKRSFTVRPTSERIRLGKFLDE